MDFDKLVRESLDRELSSPVVPAFSDSMIGQARARRAIRYAIESVSVVAVSVATVWLIQSAGLFSDSGSPSILPAAPNQSQPAHPTSGLSCETGPWATYCPEAAWARIVAERAGYGVVGDTGSGLIIDNGRDSFYFKAFEPEKPESREESLTNANYTPVFEVDGTTVYFDGIRFTWDVHGLEGWLEPGPGKDDQTTDQDIVGPIIRTSLDTPYPVDS